MPSLRDLKSRDTLTKLEAIEEAINRWRGHQVVEALIEALRDDETVVREAAARALGFMGDVQAIKPLLDALRDAKGNVYGDALDTLKKLANLEGAEKPLVKALEDPDYGVRGGAAKALVEGARWEPGYHQRSLVALALAKWDELESLGRDAVGPTIAALEIDHVEVRYRCAVVLGKIGDPRAVRPLVARRRDRYWMVRHGARRALERMGSAAVVPLAEVLKDEDWRTRKEAAATLGWIPDVRAVELLVGVLKDKDGRVRWSAALALGRIRDASAVECLLAALGDSDGYVRGAAAWALGEIGASQAVRALTALLNDSESDVRGAARVALLKTSPPPPAA